MTTTTPNPQRGFAGIFSKIGLIPRIFIAIILGILIGAYAPLGIVRVFATINSIFSEVLRFSIPLIILGLVSTAIGDIGRGAGKMLLVTVLIAYLSTILSGFFSYGVGSAFFPSFISKASSVSHSSQALQVDPYFSISIPAPLDVMTSLVLAFTLGLGITAIDGKTLHAGLKDFEQIISKFIANVIIPFLPLYILGIFMIMTFQGQIVSILMVFFKVILIIFAVHICVLLIQYSIAGILSKQNPFKMLWRMMPAYVTALGTQSSAATIPVTLKQTGYNGVNKDVAGFVVPLCATIHLSGSTLKIVACALALMIMHGMPHSFGLFAGFICMLGVTMVAAPGVPGGAIMACLGILQSMLGFDQEMQGLMIALYITMDNFGTACNVTGDGAIAVVVNRIFGDKLKGVKPSLQEDW